MTYNDLLEKTDEFMKNYIDTMSALPTHEYMESLYDSSSKGALSGKSYADMTDACKYIEQKYSKSIYNELTINGFSEDIINLIIDQINVETTAFTQSENAIQHFILSIVADTIQKFKEKIVLDNESYNYNFFNFTFKPYRNNKYIFEIKFKALNDLNIDEEIIIKFELNIYKRNGVITEKNVLYTKSSKRLLQNKVK